MAFVGLKFRDAGKEYSSVRAEIADQAGATTFTAMEVIADGFSAAAEGLSIGVMVSAIFSQETDSNPDAAAADPFAQRELGVRFFFTDDTVGRKGYITIPCPDLANIDLESDGDTLDLTDAEAAAMVTWIEANLTIGGNNVDVDRAVVVGRAN